MPWRYTLLALIGVAASSGQELVSENDPSSNTDATYCGDVPLTCKDTKYRSYDGSCNNLEHSWWGTPFTPYRRMLCNSNAGEVEAIFNQDLPNPRTVSLRSFVDVQVEDTLWTLLFMQYGQIVAHDLSFTSDVAQSRKNYTKCCTVDKKPIPKNETNPRCAPILTPRDDPFYSPEKITCMDFFRVETTKDGKNCTNASDVAEPLTAVTAYLDVSYLYGSNDEMANKVREFRRGQLAYVKRNRKIFLPQDPEPEIACNVDSHAEPCYFAGDVRLNQNPQLALLHNIYMLHHNIIAGKLAKINPHWNDETLFQETRRIVIATHQWIIYHEFLPGLLGQDFVVENKLFYPGATGYVNDYDPSVNAAVSNEFAACAFRTYHSEIVGMIRAIKDNRNTSNIIKLSDWYDKPSVCEHADNYNRLMRGLATQAQSAVDRYMPNDILNQLLKEPNELFGSDLKAIDIQRGRDQGVCSCAKALRAFNLTDVQSFQDFEKIMKPEKVVILEDLYKSPEDVDLCTCVFLEDRIPRSLTGPLTRQILGEQFRRSRVGDRCFFENGNGECAFTVDQVNEIRNSTLAEIFCYNNDIKEIQPEVFKQISKRNPLKPCKSIRKFNPKPWQENTFDSNL